VTPRTNEQIEKAFRDMGLNETTWGSQDVSVAAPPGEIPRAEQVFIRAEATTTPLESKDAHLA
jgi:hypothetical protein